MNAITQSITNSPSKHYHNIILGAGISGLTTAFYLQKSNKDQNFIILEKNDRVGGRVFTDTFNNNLVEHGPNALILRKKEFRDILCDLQLENELIYPPAQSKKRYICKNGKLISVSPSSLLLKSDLTDLKAKIKLLLGGYTSTPQEKIPANQNIFDFFATRFSNKFAENLIIPLVSGIYAGDARKVIMKNAFPKIYEFALNSNSLLLGAIKTLLRKKQKQQQNKQNNHKESFQANNLASFKDGLNILSNTIYKNFEKQVILNSTVTSISKDNFKKMWIIKTANESYTCKNLINTLPAISFAELLLSDDLWFNELKSYLKNINYSSVIIVHLTYNKSDIKNKNRGFGFLNTHENNLLKRPLRILGTLFSSYMFPSRTSTNQELFTVFLGGDLYPQIKQLSDKEIIDLAHTELTKILQINASIANEHSILRWDLAIPQYDQNHLQFKDWINRDENTKEYIKNNLYWSTNYWGGISVPDCMINAKNIAQNILEESI
ncbi:MAG: protoporphyrinogen oxidase [Oligoflexia bacterium]|nr:protoporphyrinogen oxidase [Oligoflexia bacterium]